MQRAFNLSNDSQTTKFGVDEDQALAFRSGGPRQTRRRSLWIDFLIEDAKTDDSPKFCDLSHPQAFSQLISVASA
jgi:hypothetical protein